MLQHVIHTFDFPTSIPEAARSDLTAYEELLKSKGYVARTRCVAHEDPSRPIITISGIACWPDCLARALADRQICDVLEGIHTVHGARDAIRYELAAGTADEEYAGEPPWTHLRLVCDCIFGISPLRTADGGIVGRFVLRLDDDLAAALWRWDFTYHSIYACWLGGGDYEQWAERELSNSTSLLNIAGQTLANRLSRVIGCAVDYVRLAQKP